MAKKIDYFLPASQPGLASAVAYWILDERDSIPGPDAEVWLRPEAQILEEDRNVGESFWPGPRDES